MLGHPGAFGDGLVASHIRVEFHIRPDLRLGFRELVRRSDAPYPIPQGLPLRVHLLDQHLQLCLTLLLGVNVDAFGVLCAVRPSGGVAALEQVVIDLSDAPGTRLSLSTQHGLEVCGRILLCLSRILPHLVAQSPVDLGRCFVLHIPGDICIAFHKNRLLWMRNPQEPIFFRRTEKAAVDIVLP